MLSDEQKKKLTEYLGECWHKWEPASNGNYKCVHCSYVTFRDFYPSQRTFTTDADFLALCRKAVEKDEWAEFWEFAERKELCSGIVTYNEFAVWLFLDNPERACCLAAMWLEEQE